MSVADKLSFYLCFDLKQLIFLYLKYLRKINHPFDKVLLLFLCEPTYNAKRFYPIYFPYSHYFGAGHAVKQN